MSLTMALKAIDGLVLAADSRVTEGYTLEGPKTRDDSVKFVQLNGDWGVLTYGLSDIGYAGLSSLKEQILKDINSYTSVASVLDKGMHIFSRVSSDWGKGNPEIKRRDKDVGFVLAGYERGKKTFRIFNLQSPEFLPKSVRGGCLLAGKWHIAKFFMNKLYTRDMSVNMLKDLAIFLLNATMAVEKTVGGAIHLATITEPKGIQWFSEDEVNSIARTNKTFRDFFQEQFYSSLLSVVNNNRKETNSGDVKRCRITVTN